MASMLRNNPQLFNLYVGYEDGSFLEMDVIDRANPGFRSSLHVDEDAAYRVVIISRTGNAALKPVTVFLSENLIQVAETSGPTGYDPRKRPWYVEAFKDETTLLTGPYVFYATGQPGYTLRTRLKEGRRGVVAGDLLLNRLEEMLGQQRLGQSGLAFLFNDANRVVGHPEMDRLMDQTESGETLPNIGVIRLDGLAQAIQSWRRGGGRSSFSPIKPGEPMSLPSIASRLRDRPIFAWRWSRRSMSFTPRSFPSAEPCSRWRSGSSSQHSRSPSGWDR
jgi:adenylate cyclase